MKKVTKTLDSWIDAQEMNLLAEELNSSPASLEKEVFFSEEEVASGFLKESSLEERRGEFTQKAGEKKTGIANLEQIKERAVSGGLIKAQSFSPSLEREYVSDPVQFPQKTLKERLEAFSSWLEKYLGNVPIFIFDKRGGNVFRKGVFPFTPHTLLPLYQVGENLDLPYRKGIQFFLEKEKSVSLLSTETIYGNIYFGILTESPLLREFLECLEKNLTKIFQKKAP